MDFVIETSKMPAPGETVIGNNFSLVPGGKGANQAYALGKLGANTIMIGAVGNDNYGIKLLDNLNSVNVNTNNIVKLDNVNTGCAFITVDNNGENCITVISGANEKLNENMIYNNKHIITEADIIIMQLEIPLEIVNLVAKIAKEHNKFVILDPAPAVSNISDELLKNIDIIKPNETEIEILSGQKIESNEDVINAARLLIQKGVKNVIVTLGKKGSLLITKDVVKSFSALDVKAIDTTAAGDSFTAALAKSLSEGKSLDDAINYGHLVSSIVVTRKGAQSSIPSPEEIENFIKIGL